MTPSRRSPRAASFLPIRRASCAAVLRCQTHRKLHHGMKVSNPAKAQMKRIHPSVGGVSQTRSETYRNT